MECKYKESCGHDSCNLDKCSEFEQKITEIIKYKSNDGEFDYSDLEKCPFCGTKPEIQFKGNNHTKKREVKIKCKKCRVQLINAGLRLDSKQLAEISIDAWNSRCA